jgi:hypothetical protein
MGGVIGDAWGIGRAEQFAGGMLWQAGMNTRQEPAGGLVAMRHGKAGGWIVRSHECLT